MTDRLPHVDDGQRPGEPGEDVAPREVVRRFLIEPADRAPRRVDRRQHVHRVEVHRAAGAVPEIAVERRIDVRDLAVEERDQLRIQRARREAQRLERRAGVARTATSSGRASTKRAIAAPRRPRRGWPARDPARIFFANDMPMPACSIVRLHGGSAAARRIGQQADRVGSAAAFPRAIARSSCRALRPPTGAGRSPASRRDRPGPAAARRRPRRARAGRAPA